MAKKATIAVKKTTVKSTKKTAPKSTTDEAKTKLLDTIKVYGAKIEKSRRFYLSCGYSLDASEDSGKSLQHAMKTNEDAKFICDEFEAAFPRILLNEKCLLISISGSIGRVAIFSNSQKAFIGGAVAVGKFKDRSLLEWVMFNLQSQKGQEKLFINVKQGSHQNLILDDIRKIKIPIPPREERDKIVLILTDIENEILSLEKKLSKSKMLKQGMMQELLTGKIRLV